MSTVNASTAAELPGAGRLQSQAGTAAQSVCVELVEADRLSSLQGAWRDLVQRAAEPNAFMDPALLAAAFAADPDAQVHALLAWSQGSEPRALLGLWAFAVGRPEKSILPLRLLLAPPNPHGHLATPVIDRACLDEVLDAMLDRLAQEPRRPTIAALAAMGDGPTMQALTRVLARRDSAPCIMARTQRPRLQSDLDGKAYFEKALSGSSRKKLRQHRRRLAEKGVLRSVMVSDPAAVRGAIENFLALEASGWKARQGTALICKEANAAFMRQAVLRMAEQGCASILALELDGRPVSMQIILRCGSAAFTWKTAYDEVFQDFSPGMLLLEDYTSAFLADPEITFADSCATDDSGFMSVWTERQAIADIWFDVRRGSSLAFRVLGGVQKFYSDVRARAKTAYLALERWRKRW
jgi:CelD/BcsL family acetyltransferase involved in cellulose biosynthesis